VSGAVPLLGVRDDVRGGPCVPGQRHVDDECVDIRLVRAVDDGENHYVGPGFLVDMCRCDRFHGQRIVSEVPAVA